MAGVIVAPARTLGSRLQGRSGVAQPASTVDCRSDGVLAGVLRTSSDTASRCRSQRRWPPLTCGKAVVQMEARRRRAIELDKAHSWIGA